MNFAVIDTETNWYDKVMSLGIVIADSLSFDPVRKLYYIFNPEYSVGGVFVNSLHRIEDTNVSKFVDSRANSISHILTILNQFEVSHIFAYNARFDHGHLPEFSKFKWIDIMKVAAYKQYNKFIPEEVEVYPGSGRIKKGFGVEPVYRMVTGHISYKEKHNGYQDAFDELVILQKLGVPFDDVVSIGKIN